MKILGFDNWAQGGRHFERLVPAFTDAGMELLLVHLGSWGIDPGRPLEEMQGQLKLRDISYYGGIDFERILDEERPDAVLLLSTQTFAHRAFLRYCHARGIPSVHLFHGLIRVQAVDNPGQQVYKPHPLSYLGFVLSRIGKSLRKTWPAYARSLVSSSAAPADWARFISDIRDGAIGRYHYRPAAADARTNKICVYTSADVPHATHTYGLAPADVIPVGNPDLIAFGLEPHMIGQCVGAPSSDQKFVMYIDTALVAMGLVFRSDAEYVEHMLAVRDSLARQGKVLLFKPHPDMRIRGVDKTLSERGVEVIDNADFTKRLADCCACIAETTTLAMVPALMGIPLLLAQFGRLSKMRYGEVLLTYPRARVLENVDDVVPLLAAERAACEPARVWEWIHENAGPLPATDMPKRVANVILQLIAAR
jgi:hypothetical protein